MSMEETEVTPKGFDWRVIRWGLLAGVGGAIGFFTTGGNVVGAFYGTGLGTAAEGLLRVNEWRSKGGVGVRPAPEMGDSPDKYAPGVPEADKTIERAARQRFPNSR